MLARGFGFDPVLQPTMLRHSNLFMRFLEATAERCDGGRAACLQGAPSAPKVVCMELAVE